MPGSTHPRARSTKITAKKIQPPAVTVNEAKDTEDKTATSRKTNCFRFKRMSGRKTNVAGSRH